MFKLRITKVITAENITVHAVFRSKQRIVNYSIYIYNTLPDNPSSWMYGAVWCQIYLNGSTVIHKDDTSSSYTGQFYMNYGDTISYKFGSYAGGSCNFSYGDWE